MAPLEPWEKVFMNLGDNTFADIDPNHGDILCENCHGGNGMVEGEVTADAPVSELAAVKNEAHSAEMSFVADPSAQQDSPCQMCHYDIVDRNEHSMHTMAWGERYKLAIRELGTDNFNVLPVDIQHEFTNECGSCHTTCGECHISRPNSVGGGFVERHKFRSPHMRDNCTACHGTRIGDDYFGNLQGNVADVHFRQGFDCLDCHNEDFHGEGTEAADPPDSRYEVAGLPQCVDCHADDTDANQYHETHWAGEGSQSDLSCFVCHSQSYNSCNSCHTNSEYREGYQEVAPDVHEGARNYKEFPSFKIAVNPAYETSGSGYSPALNAHPESELILVRHIPVVETTFDPWGLNQLNNYAIQETWEYTSPHNIKRWTEQTLVDTLGGEFCGANCHFSTETDSLYLTQEYLEQEYPDEVGANAHMIPEFASE